MLGVVIKSSDHNDSCDNSINDNDNTRNNNNNKKSQTFKTSKRKRYQNFKQIIRTPHARTTPHFSTPPKRQLR